MGDKVKRTLGSRLFIMCLVFLSLVIGKKEAVNASVGDAYSYYMNYGNQAIFQPTSVTDGYIYYATQGANATSGTRYRTIGWKVVVADGGGNPLQYIYFKTGGSYMAVLSNMNVGGYTYNLYGIPLSTLKARMNGNAYSALLSGNCSITLDACMTVVYGNVESGAMDDYGNFSGAVYSTYEGIAYAQNWTPSSRNALYSYFHKTVGGLFYAVNVSAGNGIQRVYGGGTYCYGVTAQIGAEVRRGYVFQGWSGSSYVSSQSFPLIVNSNSYWYATARPIQTAVIYDYNAPENSSLTKSITYSYDGNQSFWNGQEWKRAGYHLLGWSYERNSEKVDIKLGQGMSNEWILAKSPSVKLYAVWEKNLYTLRFDGNGATEGTMESIRAYYEDSVILPANQYIKDDKQCTFVGWHVNQNAYPQLFEDKETVVMADVAQMADKQYDSGEIILYAIWDFAPEIHAGDLYISLKDANEGKISKEKISEYISVTDKEDGELKLLDVLEVTDVTESGFYVFADYDANCFLEMTEDGEVDILITAIDHVGNLVKEPMKVHIVDTTVQYGDDVIGNIRFIRKKTLLDSNDEFNPEELGGLKSNSIWKARSDYSNLLLAVVRLR